MFKKAFLLLLTTQNVKVLKNEYLIKDRNSFQDFLIFYKNNCSTSTYNI